MWRACQGRAAPGGAERRRPDFPSVAGIVYARWRILASGRVRSALAASDNPGGYSAKCRTSDAGTSAAFSCGKGCRSALEPGFTACEPTAEVSESAFSSARCLPRRQARAIPAHRSCRSHCGRVGGLEVSLKQFSACDWPGSAFSMLLNEPRSAAAYGSALASTRPGAKRFVGGLRQSCRRLANFRR